MGATDGSQLCSWHSWYKKLLLHILDMALLNTHALYLMENQTYATSDFQMSIIRGILENHKEKNFI